MGVIQILRDDKRQPIVLDPTKVTITIDSERKTLHNQSKFKHYLSTNPTLQRAQEGKC